MKTDFETLRKSTPNCSASKIITLVEDLGGSTRKPSYDGMHLIGADGKVFALLKCVKGDTCSLYLHSTTVEQAQEFARKNNPAWEDRIVTDKKGYVPARLVGITSDEVTPEFMALVQGVVSDGQSQKARVREAKKAEASEQPLV